MNDFDETIDQRSEQETDITAEPAVEKKDKTTKWIFGWLDDLVLYFVAFILIMSFVFRPVNVIGDSMKQTLYNGDILLLNGIMYEPEYGDIIVVSRENKPDRPLIKRVIAVSGDTVTVDYETYTVYVNGKALEEDYAYIDPDRGFGENTDPMNYPYVVPENCVFVLGDNRGNSTDSREVGAIEYGQILGKAVFRIYRDTSKYEGSLFGPVE